MFAGMLQDENYKCMLDDQSLLKAKRELNEDPKERVGALKALREWVTQQKWLKSPLGWLKHFIGSYSYIKIWTLSFFNDDRNKRMFDTKYIIILF
jgi:hypothetical protein